MSKEFLTITTINGKFVKRGDDKISVFDNSLLYAEGLFETFLSIGDDIIFLKDHLARLYRGAKIMGLTIPVPQKTLIAWMYKTVKAHPHTIKKLRMTITSGEAARWVGVKGKAQVILSASPHEMPSKPFKVDVSEFRVDQRSEFRKIKTISYAIHAVALKLAKQRKCDDALMLNGKNQVAEVSSANIFWMKNKKMYTPPLSAGCLEGITRKILIREAKKSGFQVTEKNCTLHTLYKADEVFISSSLKLVIPISAIKDGKSTHKIPLGEISPFLHAKFAKISGLSKYQTTPQK